MFSLKNFKEVYPGWLFVIIWMGVIFLMSTDFFSFSKTSKFLFPLLQTIFPGLSLKSLHSIHVFLRKSGHFTEYAVLSFLWFRTLQSGEKKWSTRSAFLAFFLSACYAATDEFHQSFVLSRGPSLLDVGIDSAGAAFSLFVLRLLKA